MDTAPSGTPPGSSEKPIPFGAYTLLRVLGQGGMGKAFLAERVGPGDFRRTVVVKVLLPDNKENGQYLSWFFDEASIHGRLHHQNIVAVHEFGEHEGQHFLVLEYVEGTDLRNLMRRLEDERLLLPVDAVINIGYELAAALKHAHELTIDGVPQKLVHRDVTPANVLLSIQGHAKLGDFGVVKATTRLSRTETGGVKGKIIYMSPEQLLAAELDGRSDLFAVGVMLFELLSGKHPFRLRRDDPDAASIQRILKGDRPNLGDVAPHVPPAVREIVDKLLETEVDDRVASAEALLDLLEPLTRGASAARQLSEYVAAARGTRDFPSTAVRRAYPPGLAGPDEPTRTRHENLDGEAGKSKAPGRPGNRALPNWTRWAVLSLAVVVAALLAVRSRTPSDPDATKGTEQSTAPQTRSRVNVATPEAVAIPEPPPLAPSSETKASVTTATDTVAIPPKDAAPANEKPNVPAGNPQAETAQFAEGTASKTVEKAKLPVLAARTAHLRVMVVPFGDVEVGGQRGKAPMEFDLPPGSHTVKAGRTPALVHRQRVRLKAGEDKQLVVELLAAE